MFRFNWTSKTILTILTLFVTTNIFIHIGLLIYFGIQTHWWAPFVLVAVGLASNVPLARLTARVPDHILSLAGFPIVTLALWLTWRSMTAIAHAFQ